MLYFIVRGERVIMRGEWERRKRVRNVTCACDAVPFFEVIGVKISAQNKIPVNDDIQNHIPERAQSV